MPRGYRSSSSLCHQEKEYSGTEAAYRMRPMRLPAQGVLQLEQYASSAIPNDPPQVMFQQPHRPPATRGCHGNFRATRRSTGIPTCARLAPVPATACTDYHHDPAAGALYLRFHPLAGGGVDPVEL